LRQGQFEASSRVRVHFTDNEVLIIETSVGKGYSEQILYIDGQAYTVYRNNLGGYFLSGQSAKAGQFPSARDSRYGFNDQSNEEALLIFKRAFEGMPAGKEEYFAAAGLVLSAQAAVKIAQDTNKSSASECQAAQQATLGAAVTASAACGTCAYVAATALAGGLSSPLAAMACLACLGAELSWEAALLNESNICNRWHQQQS